MSKTLKTIVILCTLVLIAVLVFSLASESEPTTNEDKPAEATFTFISLGDSVASGMGLPTYTDPSACNRTAESYPELLATELNANVEHLACSGARYDAGILQPQQVNELEVASQLSRLEAIGVPEFITITTGANDTDWVDVITNCYIKTCGNTADTQEFDNTLTTVREGLTKTLETIESRYEDTPPVYVSSYHQVLPAEPSASCRDLGGITDSERLWARQQQAKLNQTIQEVVDNVPFATLAPIDFSGHELCSEDSWVQGLNDSAPYHPTEAGQAAYADALIELLP